MECCRVGNWSIWIMRCHSHVIRLAHVCNPARLSKSTTVTQVRLENMACLQFTNPAELPACGQPFPGGDRNFYAPANLEHGVGVFRRNGFLAEQRTKLFDGVDVLDCLSRRRSTVKVDHDIHLIADGMSQIADHSCEMLHRRYSFDGPRIGNAYHLDRRVTLLAYSLCTFNDL